MDADIAQRVQAAFAVARHDDRAAVGIEPEVAAGIGEPRHVVCGHPWSGKDPLPFGGEDRGFVKQSRIRRNLAVLAKLFAESSNAGWKVHLKFS